MRHRTVRIAGLVLALVSLSFAALSEPPVPRKDGTLKDMERLPASANRAAKAFDKLPVFLDASALGKSECVSMRSSALRLKPDTRYTLAVTYRAKGKSIATAGIQSVDSDRPVGLSDTADLRATFPASKDWTRGVLTFQSDPKLPEVRILLKAWGGMRVEFKDITLVEGWYAN